MPTHQYAARQWQTLYDVTTGKKKLLLFVAHNGRMDCHSILPIIITHLILSIATAAVMKMAKLAAQKLIHPAVPPTKIRQRTPNTISAINSAPIF
jgi:hypothetical protein